MNSELPPDENLLNMKRSSPPEPLGRRPKGLKSGGQRQLPVNFRKYFLAELLLHADGTESTDIVYFLINFTMQSIQTGVEEIVSTKTFAGCISSK